MAYYEAGDGRRVYFEHYHGPKSPVFLIQGWGMSSRVWVDTIEALKAAGHEVLTIDHRGCGQSDRDFDDLSVNAIASDVEGIVRQRGLRPVVLNGWSLGGAIAAEAAQRLGERAAALVLTCGASPRFTRTDDFPYGGERDIAAKVLRHVGHQLVHSGALRHIAQLHAPVGMVGAATRQRGLVHITNKYSGTGLCKALGHGQAYAVGARVQHAGAADNGRT